MKRDVRRLDHDMMDTPVLMLSVIIPTLRRPDRLRQTLRSLAECDPAPDEVLVVDGDDDRSSQTVVEEFVSRLPIRYAQTAGGLTRQRNFAMDRVEGDVIVFFDDDVHVSSDALAVVRDAFSDPDVVGFTGRVIEVETRSAVGKHSPLKRFLPGGGPEGTFTRYGYPNRLIHLGQARDLYFMEGSFMAGRADAVRQVRFDENLPGYALAEDEDFSYRLSRLGRIVYRPAAWVYHDRSGATGADARRFGRAVVVNRHYLFKKNFAQSIAARIQFGFLVMMLLVHRILNRDWQGALGIVDGARAIWLPKR